MYHVCYQFLIIHTHTAWFFGYNRQSLDIIMYTTTDVFAWQLYSHTYTTTPLLDHLQQQWHQARVLNSLSFIVLHCWHWTSQPAQKLGVPKALKYSVVWSLISPYKIIELKFVFTDMPVIASSQLAIFSNNSV